MSDTILLGVLRMPFEIAMATLTARIQYHQRGVQAADEIEKRTRERDEARAEVERLRAEIERLIRLNKMLERNEREFLAAIGLATTTVLGSGHDPYLALSSMKLVVAKVERLRAEIEKLRADNERLHEPLKRPS